MDELELLKRITVNPEIFGGKPIIRGRRLAVEHVLDMLAAGDSAETILEGYPWLSREDILACLVYARRYIGVVWSAPGAIETSPNAEPSEKVLLDVCTWGKPSGR